MESKNLHFAAIYQEFAKPIERYLLRFLEPREAEEVTQEVFLKVNSSLADFRHEAKLSTWIYKIATNMAIDRLKKASYRFETKQISLQEPERSAPVEAQHANSVESNAIHKEMNQCIRGVIDGLPENYRLVIVLSELGGFSNQEIADILGLSIGVVKTRLHRGKKCLKEELTNACNFSWDERNEFACDPKK
nr:sigma-70 family RNA polymerase sigma factor [uncultured Anaeromusa sp.]